MNHRDNEEDFIVRNEDIVEDERHENIFDEAEEGREREIISISKGELELPSKEPLIVISREETTQRKSYATDWPHQPAVPQGRGITRKLIYALSPVLVLCIGLGIYFGIFWQQSPKVVDVDPEPNISWLARIDPAVAVYASELENNGFDISQNEELKVVFRASIEGQEYSVAKYRSSPVGLQVFDVGDNLVTVKSVVDKVLASYVWSRHSNRMTAEERANIQNTYDRVSDLIEQGAPVFEANGEIKDLLDYKDRIEDWCIDRFRLKGCVWEVVYEVSPTFGVLVDATEVISRDWTRIENLLESIETSYGKVLYDQKKLSTDWPSDSTAMVVEMSEDKLAVPVATAITSSKDLEMEIGDITAKVDEIIYLIDTVIDYLDELREHPISGYYDFADSLIDRIKAIRTPIVLVSVELDAIMTQMDASETALTQAKSRAQSSEDIASDQWKYRP